MTQQHFTQRTHFQMSEQLEAERAKREEASRRFREEVERRARVEVTAARFERRPCLGTMDELVTRIAAEVRRDWGLA